MKLLEQMEQSRRPFTTRRKANGFGNRSSMSSNFEEDDGNFWYGDSRVTNSIPLVFSGEHHERVDKWLNDFERIAELKGWDAGRRLAVLALYLKDAALVWLEHYKAVGSSDAEKWKNLKVDIQSSFSYVEKKSHFRKEFQRRVQKEGELVNQYFWALKFLAKEAGVNDDDLLQRFESGLNSRIKKAMLLMQKGKDTLEECLKSAVGIEKDLLKLDEEDELNAMIDNDSASKIAKLEEEIRRLKNMKLTNDTRSSYGNNYNQSKTDKKVDKSTLRCYSCGTIQ